MATSKTGSTDSTAVARSDEALFTHFAATGDQSAFEELLSRRQDGFYRLALLICRNRALAEEAVQEAVMWLATQAKKFRDGGNGSFRNWSYGVVRNCSKHMLRKEVTRSSRAAAAARAAGGQAIYVQEAEEDTEKAAVQAAMNKALDTLEEKLRTAVALHFLDGLTYEAISAVEGVSAQMIHRRVQKGLSLLRRSLSKAGFTLSVAAVGEMLLESGGVPAPESLVKVLGETVRKGARAAKAGRQAGTAGESIRAAGALAAGSSKVAWAVVGVAALVAAVVAGAWGFTARQAASRDTKGSAAGTQAPTHESAVSVAWNFNDKKTAGLKFLVGKPGWGGKVKTPRGLFLTFSFSPKNAARFGYGSPVIITLTRLKLRPPCLVECDVSGPPGSSVSTLGGYWGTSFASLPYVKRIFSPASRDLPTNKAHGKTWLHFKMYITDKEVFHLCGDEFRVGFSLVRPWRGPQDHLYLVWSVKKGVLLIDNLSVRNVKPEDVPVPLR